MEETARSNVREVKLWYAVLGRGSLALLFAVLVMSDPFGGLGGLAKLFALYALADGALALYAARRVRRTHTVERGPVLLVEGIVNVAVAVLVLAIPTVAALRVLGGVRALAIGASEVLRSRRGNASDLVELGGIAAVGLGLLVLAWPGPGDLAMRWLLGLVAFVSGGLAFGGGLSHFRTEAEAASHA